MWRDKREVVICSKFITFAVTKTTTQRRMNNFNTLWFAQNSLPLRWQRQLRKKQENTTTSCDLLKIHYLCGDKDNIPFIQGKWLGVVICSKFITFAVTKTTYFVHRGVEIPLWFAQNSLPLRWQRQLCFDTVKLGKRCDLLKIHYLCGDKDNRGKFGISNNSVVICSKFITFAVTKTTRETL